MNPTLRALAGVLAGVVVSACAPSDPAGPTASPAPSGPTPASEVTSPETGGELRYVLRYDPEFIDPGFVLESEGAVVVDALFDSLMAYDDQLRPIPAAAQRYEVDDTGTVYTFHLVEGGTFHDGSPVDAAAFVRAWNRIVDGSADELSPNAHHLAAVAGYEEARREGIPLSGLEVVDAHTLRVTLRFPYADFPAVVAHPSLAPVPAGALSDTAAFREAPIGNGPFAMAGPWQHDEFIRVERFEDHRDPPELDEVVFRIYSGDDAEEQAYADFQAGLLHVATVPRERLDAATERFGRSADGYTGPGVLTGQSLFLYYYGFNTELPPFDDPDVRRAISLLIDRERIATEVMDGTRTPATSLVPPGVPGSVPDTCAYCRYAPEEAVELLEGKELGELTITFNDHPVQRAIATRVAADIGEALGTQVGLRGLPFSEYLDVIRSGEIGLFRLGWEAEYPTMDNFIWSHVSSEALGDTNVFRFSDPESVDQRLVDARATLDADERAALYVEAERAALDQAPLAPMLFYRHSHVVSAEVQGFVLRPNGLADLTRVTVSGG